MAKREVNWQPDIYDMASGRADDPPPTTPRPSGRISNLMERRRKGPPSPPVIADYLDDEDISLLPAAEDDLLLDDVDANWDGEEDSNYAVVTPAKGTRGVIPAQRRVAQADDNSGLLGLLLGALVGAGLTLLVTPTGGKQLRARLQAEVQHQAAQGQPASEIVAHNMPNTIASEQTAPVAGAARP